ncbi:STAS/SEC14 domain-containing protein [Altererythrobacter sp. H2]|uniref:STAS/SEC14 domain-containing protein n=1 Tax=Altererythrobacter sp. H2 TaxID=3108391 RepID=UPI002B4C1467|nr:STAS/SEC14 domain-containing protein [Altererythrobacter sp. H2]WRK96476.1 STAS/SEC14 domain-containing protein [Altererythrobacter sp. H2]
MLIELSPDFTGWDPGGIWRDLKFDAKHKDSFGRIAIVGDRKWEEWGTKVSDPHFRAKMKFFEPLERDAAESWARDERNAA